MLWSELVQLTPYSLQCKSVDASIEYSVIIECVDINKHSDTSETINTDNCIFYCKHQIIDKI